MCRNLQKRWEMVSNITEKTVSEITIWLSRAVKLYFVLAVINLLFMIGAITSNENGVSIGMDVSATILYVLYTLSLYNLTNESGGDPTLESLFPCTCALVLLLIFSVIQLTFDLSDDPMSIGNYLHIFGIIVEASTLYVHYHLHKKLKMRSNENLNMEGDSSSNFNKV
jgi:hypothetical protein